MIIREQSILSEEARELIAQLDQELLAVYKPENWHPVDLAPFHRDGGIFVIGYDGDRPVACGALRPYSGFEIELKRMYVVNSHRSRGLSRQILAYLEEKAEVLGYERIILETGDKQQAALALYRSAGYEETEPYGEYIDSPVSRCFVKILA